MKKYFMFYIIIVLLSSCENVLDEVPKNFISRVNYFKNETDAQGAINGVYSTLGPDYFNVHIYLMEELHGDYINGRGGQAPVTNFDQLLNTSGISYATSNWNYRYSLINRANSVIDNVPNIENISESVRTRILAEAHFLRAMTYFDLVRLFGPVPLRLQESTDFSTLAAPRDPVDKIYDQIVEDALAAENGLPENVGTSTGKASKWAAKMLLANIYLTTGKWNLAAEKANDVINSGVYSLVNVQVPDDFYKIFAVSSSSEDIMSVHHSANKLSQVPIFMHYGNALPWNQGTGYYSWLPNTNSWIGQSWDNKDLRKSFNFYSQYQNAKGIWVPLPSTVPILFKKFIKSPEGLSIYSLPIYRYAEALLIFAEASCMAEGSPSALALERLNMVKRRAYGYNPAVPSLVDYSPGMIKEQFREVVLQERGYEFIMERKRFYDLKRTGTVKEAFAKVGKIFIDARLFFPLPQDEINNNPALTKADQNPGY
jgi:starch-binding outer membrane protein, SusD/RagB family